MKKLALLLVTSLCLLAPGWSEEQDVISGVLDDFHKAASQADGDRYFGHFTTNGIFLGTDITERWTVEEFKAYAEPHFSKGKGWTYRPSFRKIYLSPGGESAWFDEVLENKSYGQTRGSGVLVKTERGWKIAQYHLTLPVPNSLMKQVVEMIAGEKR